ncbi:hypothetical protein JW988_07960 [Candidatus Bathyarchaeota archaeon]|nr:hypothetical protein [Candidatus Bathyarchaeota archaeon]
MSKGRGFGRGRGGERQQIGGPASCKCPKCGYTIPHTRGTPCTSMICPKCGISLVDSD